MLRTMDMLDEGVVRSKCLVNVNVYRPSFQCECSFDGGWDLKHKHMIFKFLKILTAVTVTNDNLRFYTLHFHSTTNSPGTPQQHRRTCAEDAVGACSNVQRGSAKERVPFPTIDSKCLIWWSPIILTLRRRVWLTFFCWIKSSPVVTVLYKAATKHWRELETQGCSGYMRSFFKSLKSVCWLWVRCGLHVCDMYTVYNIYKSSMYVYVCIYIWFYMHTWSHQKCVVNYMFVGVKA